MWPSQQQRGVPSGSEALVLCPTMLVETLALSILKIGPKNNRTFLWKRSQNNPILEMRKLISGKEMPLVWGHVASEWLDRPDTELLKEAASLLVLSLEPSPWKDAIHGW